MIKESDYIAYLNALLNGNKSECIKIVDGLLKQGTGLKSIYFDLLSRSMYRVGALWNKQKCSIVDERIASDITLNIVDLIYPLTVKTPRNGKTIVIACIDKEHHSIGPRIISDYFTLSGWNSIFLGASVPANEILKALARIKPDLMGISSNYMININRLTRLIEDIKLFAPKQKIIVGGQIFSDGKQDLLEKYKNVKYVQTVKQLDKFVLPNSKKKE